jgi:putative ABC transport system permease protein
MRIDMLWQDMRFGLRMLMKNPGFANAVILMLALGIGANTALFSVVKTVLLNSLPYKDPKRLVTMVASDRESLDPENVSFGKARDWRERSHSFESIALYRGWRPTLTGMQKPEVLLGGRVSKEFFGTLGISPALGRDFLPEEDRPDRWHVVLLSYAFWREQLGERSDVVGSTIQLNQMPYQVVGVLPQTFEPLIFSYYTKPPQVWAPLGYAASDPSACRTCQHLRSVARLKEGATVESARAEMGAITANLIREFPNDYALDEIVLIRALQEHVVGNVRATLWLLLGATGFVLLIACANIANLMLSRALVRQRELTVRAALGASRVQLARQMLAEMMLLTVAGGILGALLANWGVIALARWGPVDIPRLAEAKVDKVVLFFSLALTVLTGLAAGFFPALQAARADEREALQRIGRGTVGVIHGRLRSLLVVGEIGLAFVLAIGTGLLLRSLKRLSEVQPGFETHNLHSLVFALTGPKYEKDPPVLKFDREALERVRHIAGVESAALVSTLPLGGSYDQRTLLIQDRHYASDIEAPSVDSYYVSDSYFETMGIPLRRGRLFAAADMRAGNDAQVAIISESAAKQSWPGEDPIGKRIQLGGRDEKKPWSTIVGIVGDVKQYGLDAPATADGYLPYTQDIDNGPIVVVRSKLPTANLRRAFEEQIEQVDKDVPVVGAWSMGGLVADSMVRRRFVAELVGGFGALALLLASLGIYAVMAYGVAQRTSEFGIRMAIGALPRDVLRMVLLKGARLALAGIIAGLALALFVANLMKSLLFEISSQDPLTMVVVALLLAAVALGACWLPARRATQVDPMVALRYE